MSTRRTIGAVLAIAAAALVALWLYAIAGSTGQLRALSLPAETSADADPASQPPRVVNRAPPTPVDAPPGRTLSGQESADAPVAAEGVETEDSSSPQTAGPISGTAFSELLESGLVGEDDPLAAEELRNALREVAADSAEPE